MTQSDQPVDGRGAKLLGATSVKVRLAFASAAILVTGALIGHDLWQKRFDGDPGILGRVVHLGDAPHAVVGVMPAGFKFPVSDRLWVPLRLNPDEFERRTGPRIR